MALYLGNQKVSLKSGQDPTFDYGFDSNGRLVFANKNATEINNFLNYDSTYSEILDLSNLSKMEKVAVNGTDDRKMEGLKGLLVSPNAPFTGSSPQINVSYTGLNKSALVSLFESAPYNVGYEKVGNPTIVDGVASGFSNNDNLKLSSNFKLNTINTFELKTKITNGEKNYYTGICGSSTGYGCLGLRRNTNGTLTFRAGWSPNNTVTSSIALNTNVSYYVIATFNLSTLTATIDVSTDNINWTIDTATFDSSGNWWIDYKFGITQDGAFNGSIDLNETYIKVNGVPWFTGKAAMTKTCSIVGATGTADLTQEDKNIILNKGWSLTVQ